MAPEQLKDKIVSILDGKKADDIQVIELKNKTVIADYFVIATGTSAPHVKAICEELEFKLEEEGIAALRKEGITEGRWAVVDYGDIIVHIFDSTTRGFYSLEKLWK